MQNAELRCLLTQTISIRPAKPDTIILHFAFYILHMKIVTIFTDGACSGNPGPGGWGAILSFNGIEKELSGGEANTTNNRMELTGVIRALEALKEPCTVELYSDS